MTTQQELSRAQALMDENPILQKSPRDLKREGISIEDYIKSFSKEERTLYLAYYEDEL